MQSNLKQFVAKNILMALQKKQQNRSTTFLHCTNRYNQVHSANFGLLCLMITEVQIDDKIDDMNKTKKVAFSS